MVVTKPYANWRNMAQLGKHGMAEVFPGMDTKWQVISH